MDPRIRTRIRTKISWIRNTGSEPSSLLLLIGLHKGKGLFFSFISSTFKKTVTPIRGTIFLQTNLRFLSHSSKLISMKFKRGNNVACFSIPLLILNFLINRSVIVSRARNYYQSYKKVIQGLSVRSIIFLLCHLSTVNWMFYSWKKCLIDR